MQYAESTISGLAWSADPSIPYATPVDHRCFAAGSGRIPGDPGGMSTGRGGAHRIDPGPGAGRKGECGMSLKDRLARFDASRNRPPEIVAILRRGIDYVRESGAVGLRVGERAPDFALPNQRGETVRLADRLSKGPVVLSFYRGVW